MNSVIEISPAAKRRAEPVRQVRASVLGTRQTEWLSPALRRIVLHLAAEEVAMAERIFQAISNEIPEYRDSIIADGRSDVYTHCLLTTRAWYRTLLLGSPPQAEDLEVMMLMGAEKCRVGASLGGLLRAFRVGSMLYWEALIEAGRDDRAVTEELLSKVSRFFLHHFDQVSESVSSGYYIEQPRLLRERDRRAIQRAKTKWPLIETLTQRELGVLRLLESGRSNKEIAQAMFVCENTVKFHLRNIYGKLGASRRTEAVARAQALGLDITQQDG